MDSRLARLIAYYLPQFHPIPENDEWWGKGFTEWTNTAKAKRLFRDHYQPRVPADLGFYDLRVPEAREAQAELAEEYGIEAFCYWHYWFAGKRILERPFTDVLKSGSPRLSFCLGWANDSWTGTWHGCPDKMLIEQTYPGPKDEEAHFYALLNAFGDDRYLKVDGKPLFFIYRPYRLPEPQRFIEHWKELAIKEGLKGIYFVGHTNPSSRQSEEKYFDALVPHNPGVTTHYYFNPPPTYLDKVCYRHSKKTVRELVRSRFPRLEVMEYSEYVKKALFPQCPEREEFPCVVPNWDNTPRCGINGFVLKNSTPELFREHLRQAIEQVAGKSPEKRIIFIKSWNEWAEGNHLEPDMMFGRRYLDMCKELVFGIGKR